MSEIGRNLGKKIIAIQKAEGVRNLRQFSQVVDIAYSCIYGYCKTQISKPSMKNIDKIIKVFPQYTCYILEINPRQLSKQIILKE